MTKQYIKQYIPEYDSYQLQDMLFNRPIDEMIEYLKLVAKKLRKEGFKDLFLHEEWDYEDRTLSLFGYRLETDAEYENRLKKEKRAAERARQKALTKPQKLAEKQARIEEKEREEYERLKKKFK